MNSVLRYAAAREGKSAKSRHGRSRWNKTASCAELPPSKERTQAKKQKLKHGRFADVVSQSPQIGPESSQFPDSLAVSAAFKRGSRLLSALRDDYLESYKLPLAALFHSAFISEEYRPTLFLSIEEVKSLLELVWIGEMYHHAKQHATKRRDETSYWRAAVSMYQHGLGVAFSVERAAKFFHKKYAILAGFWNVFSSSRAHFSVSALP